MTEEEQTRLNERLLTTDQLSSALRRVNATIEKFFLVLDFSSEMLNNESPSRPDVLMLQLSTHKNKSGRLSHLRSMDFHSMHLDSTEPSAEKLRKLDFSEIEQFESKLDEIVDRLLSIRSELIARQFENDLQTHIPCRLQ